MMNFQRPPEASNNLQTIEYKVDFTITQNKVIDEKLDRVLTLSAVHEERLKNLEDHEKKVFGAIFGLVTTFIVSHFKAWGVL